MLRPLQAIAMDILLSQIYQWKKLFHLKKKYPIIGNKYLDFADFCEISSIMVAKGHTTKEGLEKIQNIKEGMNLRRK